MSAARCTIIWMLHASHLHSFVQAINRLSLPKQYNVGPQDVAKGSTIFAASMQKRQCMLCGACRPFMDGPHMFGGRGTSPYEDDDQGMGGFRGNDSGAGDALAMGMDVDIPAATSAGDRREAERRRGRDGRYGSKSVLNAFITACITGRVRRPGRQR